MSGQSAALSISEAKAMMKRTECGTNDKHQGPKSSSMTETTMKKKQEHQGK